MLAVALFAFLMLPGGEDQPPQRPPIVGVAEFAVYSADLDASARFYGELLGLPQQGTQASGALRFRVNPRQWIEVRALAEPAGANRLAHIAFETADVDALRRYLAARSVSGLSPISRRSDGARSFSLRDPLGYTVHFVQYPARLAADSAAGAIGRRLIHVGFVVTDRAAADRFYRDLLGFRLYWHGGMQDDKTDWVDMQVPDGAGWLEYMLNVPADAPQRLRGIMNHAAIGVESVAGAFKTLKERGWTAAEKPQIGRDGKWQLNLYDPDLTRIEVMEFRPVQDPCCSPYTGPHPH